MAIIYPYWKLYCKIFQLTICRSCGARLDKNYKKRRRGKLCIECYVKEAMIAGGIDIDTLYL